MNKMMTSSICSAMLALCACGYVSPDAGTQAVLVRKPWFFGSGGVDMTPVNPGTRLVAASTGAVYVQMTPIAFERDLGNIMPSNGIPLAFHTTIRVQVTNAPLLVRDWNGAAEDKDGNPANAWYWSNIDPMYVNYVRQEVKKYDMVSLAFGGEAVERAEANVTARLDDFIRRNKMPVKLLSITIGRAAPPQEIVDQRTETAAQQQRKLTMDAQAAAETARRASELARAEADNAYRAQMQLSPEQYVELQRIAMQKDACAKHGTCTFIFGGATPLISR